jgi:hypothetical protein
LLIGPGDAARRSTARSAPAKERAEPRWIEPLPIAELAGERGRRSLTVAWFGVRLIKKGHGENRSPRTQDSAFRVFGALS